MTMKDMILDYLEQCLEQAYINRFYCCAEDDFTKPLEGFEARYAQAVKDCELVEALISSTVNFPEAWTLTVHLEEPELLRHIKELDAHLCSVVQLLGEIKQRTPS